MSAGQPRSALDMIVAAVAEANDCIAVTGNARHWRGVVEMADPLSGSAETERPARERAWGHPPAAAVARAHDWPTSCDGDRCRSTRQTDADVARGGRILLD